MTALLFEGSSTIYLVLGIVVVLLLVAYWQTRKKPVLVAAGVALGVLGLYFLLDFAVETDLEADRTQIQQRLRHMAESVGQRNPERLFQHISEKFISPLQRDKKATQAEARQRISSGQVTEIRVWDVHFEEPPNRARGEATIHFQFKIIGTIETGPGFGCAANYEWSQASGWMLKKVGIFNPVLGREAIQPLF